MTTNPIRIISPRHHGCEASDFSFCSHIHRNIGYTLILSTTTTAKKYRNPVKYLLSRIVICTYLPTRVTACIVYIYINV